MFDKTVLYYKYNVDTQIFEWLAARIDKDSPKQKTDKESIGLDQRFDQIWLPKAASAV